MRLLKLIGLLVASLVVLLLALYATAKHKAEEMADHLRHRWRRHFGKQS